MSGAQFDAGDSKLVAAKQQTAKRRQKEDDAITASLMATTPGRAWMWRRLERCHVFASSFSPEALRMAMAEGERNIGLGLVADIIRACPEQYTLMAKEAASFE